MVPSSVQWRPVAPSRVPTVPLNSYLGSTLVQYLYLDNLTHSDLGAYAMGSSTFVSPSMAFLARCCRLKKRLALLTTSSAAVLETKSVITITADGLAVYAQSRG